MFCDKDVLPHKLDCLCHTTLTLFTQDVLYKLYSIMRSMIGGKDIFSRFISHLRPFIAMPTCVYSCSFHHNAWVSVGYITSIFRPGDCQLQHMGCINGSNYLSPSYHNGTILAKLRYLPPTYRDSEGMVINCDELAAHCPKEYMNNRGETYSDDDSY